METIGSKQEELAVLTKEETALNELIEKRKLRIQALSETAEEYQKKLQQIFREKHEKTFNDVNFKHALIGAKVEHKINVAGMAEFFISFPNGNKYNEVSKFVREPKFEKAELGPITETEETLLLFLIGLQMTSEPKPPRQNFAEQPAYKRLEYIRQIPIVTANHLAERCQNFRALLEVILTLDVRNF